MTVAATIRKERFLAVSMLAAAGFLLGGSRLEAFAATPTGLAAEVAVLFAVILGSCLAVVRHADDVATELGEPYGTLILTLVVTVIEVISISALAAHADGNATLARDTVFAVVMIILNFMVGVSLLLGGARHHEQYYNLQGANTYLGVLIPLTVLCLILPTYTVTTPGPVLSGAQEIFVAIVALCLYGTFLMVQTVRHQAYFRCDEEADAGHAASGHPVWLHALLILAYMAPLVFLTEHLGSPLDRLFGALHVPAAFSGVVIALLVATPEGLSAVEAAAANRLQRSTNIALGSALATISLTIPAMIALSRVTGHKIVLGLEHADGVLLMLTLAVSLITFSSGRTTVMQGAVHLVLFGAYLLLAWQG